MTAMSSRRELVAPVNRKLNKEISILAFIGGLLLIVLGVKVDSAFLAGAGFVGFVGAIMYWNTLIWGRIYRNRKIEDFDKYNTMM